MSMAKSQWTRQTKPLICTWPTILSISGNCKLALGSSVTISISPCRWPRRLECWSPASLRNHEPITVLLTTRLLARSPSWLRQHAGRGRKRNWSVASSVAVPVVLGLEKDLLPLCRSSLQSGRNVRWPRRMLSSCESRWVCQWDRQTERQTNVRTPDAASVIDESLSIGVCSNGIAVHSN